jgi:hypothetical protein
VGLPERRLPPVRLLPGQRPAQEARWPAVGNTVMSVPISAMIVSAARLPTPVMVAEPIPSPGERDEHLVDVGVELGDRGLQLLQVRHGQADQQRVVATKAAPQRLAKLGELGPQPALGQLGQDPRVALPGDQGRQHRPTRGAQHL